MISFRFSILWLALVQNANNFQWPWTGQSPKIFRANLGVEPGLLAPTHASAPCSRCDHGQGPHPAAQPVRCDNLSGEICEVMICHDHVQSWILIPFDTTPTLELTFGCDMLWLPTPYQNPSKKVNIIWHLTVIPDISDSSRRVRWRKHSRVSCHEPWQTAE